LCSKFSLNLVIITKKNKNNNKNYKRPAQAVLGLKKIKLIIKEIRLEDQMIVGV